MIPMLLSMGRVTLDSWGRPEDIGAHTVEGPITVSGKILFGSLEQTVSGGLYAATHGKYRVVYAFDEHATLVDGELALTDVIAGRTVVYGPGDSWIIAQGTDILWDIRSQSILKSYLAVTRAT